ncbi:MAG TPA: tail fiber protein [Longimicrobiales bacterium]|jgi:microcystin-dependent protein
MAEPYVGEIKMMANTFAPRGFATCSGQILSIAEYAALFAILGTAYGGDGRTTFALPDLRGRAPMHPGTGPGLTHRTLGQRVGSDQVTLSGTEMATHDHAQFHAQGKGDTDDPTDAYLARQGGGQSFYAAPGTAMTTLSAQAVSEVGGGLGHENRQPFTAVNFVIATTGVFPSRS